MGFVNRRLKNKNVRGEHIWIRAYTNSWQDLSASRRRFTAFDDSAVCLRGATPLLCIAVAPNRFAIFLFSSSIRFAARILFNSLDVCFNFLGPFFFDPTVLFMLLSRAAI